jgi:hypothetical protein
MGLAVAGCGGGVSASGDAPPVRTGIGKGDFGTLRGVCSPGNAKGATEQGVTDTTITIGTMSDPGTTVRLGLNQELFDTSVAFAGWCNAAGGILGRKIKLNQRDAKLFEVRQRMEEACHSDFMLVGGGTALDDQGVSTRVACKLAQLDAFVNTKAAVEAPYKIQTVPNPDTEMPVGHLRQVAEIYPSAIGRMGIIASELKPVAASRDLMRMAAPKIGYHIIYDEDYPPGGPPNWRPYIDAMRQKDVRVLAFMGAPDELAELEIDMKKANWYPQVIVEDPSLYDRQLTQVGGDAIRNTVINSIFYPFDEALANPPTEQYLQTLVTYVPSAKVGLLGMQSWSAWLLFAESAKKCGSNLTRGCVLENAGSTVGWTGGGLHAPTRPSSNANASTCAVLLEATPIGFLRSPRLNTPNMGIYRCTKDNVVDLSSP